MWQCSGDVPVFIDDHFGAEAHLRGAGWLRLVSLLFSWHGSTTQITDVVIFVGATVVYIHILGTTAGDAM